MFVKIIYSNGYCGCDETEVLQVEHIEEAEAYAQEYINDYATQYTYVATGWDEDFETEEEEEEYYENCSYTINEISEEEYREYERA